MSKNTKKKNAIRFGALAVAALLFLGVFSAWALSTQATAEAGIGEISVDGISVDTDAPNTLLEDTIAGRPGNVAQHGGLFTLEEDGVNEAEFTAIVYLENGADLMEEGLRSLTIDMEAADAEGDTTQTLTLENGRVAFYFEEDPFDTDLDIDINGGSYGTHPFAGNLGGETVDLMIDVEPGNVDFDTT